MKKAASDSTPIEVRDGLSEKTAKLSALLALLYGEGGEVFRQYNDTIQDEVMWLASDLASEVRALVEQVR